MKNPWIQAARLRTLPLSISGILVGTFYAVSQSYFDWEIFVLALVTTISFQVLSNFANDYGDGVKGTDNKERIGPKRALQSGAITPESMKKGIYITIIISLILAIALIYSSFSNENSIYSLLFFLLGVVSIVAAIKYTVGKNAYGYNGLGDLFVFVFFGWVSVLGSHFLYTQLFEVTLILPATAIGLLSVAVLNLNNLRDYQSDKKSNKNTLVVKWGVEKAKKYHYLILFGAIVSMMMFAIVSDFLIKNYLFTIAFIPLGIHFKTVFTNTDSKHLDPELKKVALTTFVLAILFSISVNI